MGDLYRARFAGPAPEAHAHDGALIIRYLRTSGGASKLTVDAR